MADTLIGAKENSANRSSLSTKPYYLQGFDRRCGLTVTVLGPGLGSSRTTRLTVFFDGQFLAMGLTSFLPTEFDGVGCQEYHGDPFAPLAPIIHMHSGV